MCRVKSKLILLHRNAKCFMEKMTSCLSNGFKQRDGGAVVHLVRRCTVAPYFTVQREAIIDQLDVEKRPKQFRAEIYTLYRSDFVAHGEADLHHRTSRRVKCKGAIITTHCIPNNFLISQSRQKMCQFIGQVPLFNDPLYTYIIHETETPME